MTARDIEKIEMDLLLDGIRRRYGYDFTNYSALSLKRRVDAAMEEARVTRLSLLLDKILHDDSAFDAFLLHMSVTVTEMFRDPAFYRALRSKFVPVLKTFPFAKIWLAGCATGEEAWSTAILLHEEGFLDRVRIYATDFNKRSLDIAEAGVYPLDRIMAHADNYRAAGGTRDYTQYFSTAYDRAKFKDFLKSRIIFSYHNLVTDGVFGEMNLICCRNVLIYFDRTLQDRALGLFESSLRHGGYLCLGPRETINFTAVKKQFEPADGRQRIYRKSGEIAYELAG